MRALLILLALAIAAPAQAFGAQPLLHVVQEPDGDFTVRCNSQAELTDYWCAAGNFVTNTMGLPDRTRVFRATAPPRKAGQGSRIAHHIEFPDYENAELHRIAACILNEQSYILTEGAKAALDEYIALRHGQPHFAKGLSIRNALDRARLRQANRLFSANAGPLDAKGLSTIEESDIRAGRVFLGGLDGERKGERL